MEEKTKWLVLEDEDSIHVLPESDIRPHGHVKKGESKADLANIDCPCKPKLDFSGRKPIVAHNSFEDQERINKSLDDII